MNIYEIDRRITELVNEDGEIVDFEQVDALLIDREKKIENIALFIKNLRAEAKAMKDEEDALKKRRSAAETKLENLKGYLEYALGGKRFETPRARVNFRKSEHVEVDGEFIAWAKLNRNDLLRYKEPEADKTVIKEMLKLGENIPHAKMVSISNVIIR